jgi:hypothetical protein
MKLNTISIKQTPPPSGGVLISNAGNSHPVIRSALSKDKAFGFNKHPQDVYSLKNLTSSGSRPTKCECS